MFRHGVTYPMIAADCDCKVKTVTAVAAGNASQRIRKAFAERLHCEVTDLWPDKSKPEAPSETGDNL